MGHDLGDGVTCFARQRKQTFSKREELPSGRCQHHAPPVSGEQIDPEVFLELLDARRHVRLNAVEPDGRARYAVFSYDGPKDIQRDEVQ